jgi:dihydropyrimidinase
MEGFEAWMQKAEGNCAIDYGFHMIVSDVNEQSLKEMDMLMGEGVTSFKLFMAYPGVLYSDDGQIFRAMQKAAENGGTIMMHAENGIAIDVLREQAIKRGETDPIYHSLTRRPSPRPRRPTGPSPTPSWPDARSTWCTCRPRRRSPRWRRPRPGPQRVRRDLPAVPVPGLDNLGARVRGRQVRVLDPGAELGGRPPGWYLWKYLATNDLQVVSTDHCPFCMNDHPLGVQKRLGEGDFTKIPNGLPGVEERMRLIYDGGVVGRPDEPQPLRRGVRHHPGQDVRPLPQKGTIAVGSDADIVVWDPDARSPKMSVEVNHMRVDYSAYEGKDVQGKIDMVMSRGNVLIENDQYLGSPGDGRFLKRDTNQYLI